MNKYKVVKVEPTGHEFHLVYGDIEFILEKSKDFANDQDLELIGSVAPSSDAMAFSSHHKGFPVYAFLGVSDFGKIPVSIMVHEAYHILNMVFDEIRYQHQENDELEAYMMERIFEQIYEFLNED